MWNGLFSPRPVPPPPIDLSGEVRQAQQRVASAARVVRNLACENKQMAREVRASIRERLPVMVAAEEVFEVLDAGSGSKQ